MVVLADRGDGLKARVFGKLGDGGGLIISMVKRRSCQARRHLNAAARLTQMSIGPTCLCSASTTIPSSIDGLLRQMSETLQRTRSEWPLTGPKASDSCTQY